MSRGGNGSRSWITCPNPNCGRRVGRFEYRFTDEGEFATAVANREELPEQVLTIVELAPDVTVDPRTGELLCPKRHRVWSRTPPPER